MLLLVNWQVLPEESHFFMIEDATQVESERIQNCDKFVIGQVDVTPEIESDMLWLNEQLGSGGKWNGTKLDPNSPIYLDGQYRLVRTGIFL